jgi:hypothetical protein
MDLSIILWVALVSFAGFGITAFAVYLVDKNADQQEKRR